MARLEANDAALCDDLLVAGLESGPRQQLAAQMDRRKSVWKSDFARQHHAQGKAEVLAADA